MTKIINIYDIQINNLTYKKAIALKKLLKGIPSKILIRDKIDYKIKYECYLSKFDK